MELYLTILKLCTNEPSVPKLSDKSDFIIRHADVNLLGFGDWGSVLLRVGTSSGRSG